MVKNGIFIKLNGLEGYDEIKIENGIVWNVIEMFGP